jgi:hypothetical protein
LARQARSTARKRGATARRASAMKAVRTKKRESTQRSRKAA